MVEFIVELIFKPLVFNIDEAMLPKAYFMSTNGFKRDSGNNRFSFFSPIFSPVSDVAVVLHYLFWS